MRTLKDIAIFIGAGIAGLFIALIAFVIWVLSFAVPVAVVILVGFFTLKWLGVDLREVVK